MASPTQSPLPASLSTLSPSTSNASTPARGRRPISYPMGPAPYLLPELSTATFDFYSSFPKSPSSLEAQSTDLTSRNHPNVSANGSPRKTSTMLRRANVPREDSEVLGGDHGLCGSPDCQLSPREISQEEEPKRLRPGSVYNSVSQLRQACAPELKDERDNSGNFRLGTPRDSLSVPEDPVLLRRLSTRSRLDRDSKVLSADWSTFISDEDDEDSRSKRSNDLDDHSAIEADFTEPVTLSFKRFSLEHGIDIEPSGVSSTQAHGGSDCDPTHQPPPSNLRSSDWDQDDQIAQLDELAHSEPSAGNLSLSDDSGDANWNTVHEGDDDDYGGIEHVKFDNVSAGNVTITRSSRNRRQSERIRLDADAPLYEEPEGEDEEKKEEGYDDGNDHSMLSHLPGSSTRPLTTQLSFISKARSMRNTEPTLDIDALEQAPVHSNVSMEIPPITYTRSDSIPHLPRCLRLSSRPLSTVSAEGTIPIPTPATTSVSTSPPAKHPHPLSDPTLLDSYIATSVAFLSVRGHPTSKMNAKERKAWVQRRMRERLEEGLGEEQVNGWTRGEMWKGYVWMRGRIVDGEEAVQEEEENIVVEAKSDTGNRGHDEDMVVRDGCSAGADGQRSDGSEGAVEQSAGDSR